jgi:uncharacterized protein YndB with AHSA1/START domain
MSQIEIEAEVHIAAEPTDVAGVMFDPNREPEWMGAVQSVQVLDAGIKPGGRVKRTASLMGNDFEWTTEVVSFHFPHVLELRLVDTLVEGQYTFHVDRAAGGSTARIRGVGDPGPFVALPAAMISATARQMLSGYLDRLKGLVESAGASS